MISSPNPISIAVLESAQFLLQCQQLAERLQLALVNEIDSRMYPYVLTYTHQGLAIQQTGVKAAGPVLVNFEAGAADHRRKFGGSEMIVKAVGGNKRERPAVLDVTAGLGRDSFVLATANYSIVMCERSPIVAAVLADGIERALHSGDAELQRVVANMKLQQLDALSYMQEEGHVKPDVIIIDPMFPQTKKSALVKKEMRAFHDVVGADSDSDLLLLTALEMANHRVVVKRPRKAEWLAGKKPHFSITGKAVRFDIFSLKAFSQ